MIKKKDEEIIELTRTEWELLREMFDNLVKIPNGEFFFQNKEGHFSRFMADFPEDQFEIVKSIHKKLFVKK